MSDKFKPGDRVVSSNGFNWVEFGVGTVIERTDDIDFQEVYVVKFDKNPYNKYYPFAEYLRKLTKLELALS